MNGFMRIFLQLRYAIFFACVLTALRPVSSGAEDWPSRPITIVVAFAPGSSTDYAARVLAEELSTAFGQKVIVEDKPAGGGVLASVSVAKAPPDGYTFLMTTIGPTVLRPLIDKNLPYNPFSDLIPVIAVDESPNIIVAASGSSKFHNIQDVVAYAKANPGKLTIAHPGIGSMGHLIGLLFAAEAGIKANFIGYQGSPAIVTDIVGGRIDVGSIAYGTSAANVNVLAITTGERVSFLSSAPTMKESGLPNVIGATWNAVYAPAATPREIVTKLNNTINNFLAKPETRDKFEKIGFRILGGSPEQLAKQMEIDRTKWSKVVEQAHLNLN
jgi:tripartite-type tricarboxylate transporter receptor subunit TctC